VSTVIAACGTRPEMGLSNTPGLNRNRQEAQDEGIGDVVANARDSCQREAGKGKDPVANRLQPCDAEQEAGEGTAGAGSARPSGAGKSKKGPRPR
jgi:hypothetical protein